MLNAASGEPLAVRIPDRPGPTPSDACVAIAGDLTGNSLSRCSTSPPGGAIRLPLPGWCWEALPARAPIRRPWLELRRRSL